MANVYADITNQYHAEKIKAIDLALAADENGNDFIPHLRRAAEMELRRLQQTGVVTRVTILTAGDRSCQQCQAHAGEVYTIEEALEKIPIPCQDCQKEMFSKPGYCRCSYNAIVD